MKVVGGDDIAKSEVAITAGNLSPNPVRLASEFELVGRIGRVIKDTLGQADLGCAKIARCVAAQRAWMSGQGSIYG